MSPLPLSKSVAGSAPRGIRCRLGYHVYERQEVTRHPMFFGASFTNSICVRCGRQSWINWREPEQETR